MFRFLLIPGVCSDARAFFQVASLEGYLLKNKRRPRECVQEVTKWCGAVQL